MTDCPGLTDSFDFCSEGQKSKGNDETKTKEETKKCVTAIIDAL